MATLIIAEAGVNHNGDIALAHKLIDIAAEAGADAVKFQTFSADNLTTNTAPKANYQKLNDNAKNQLDMLKSLELLPKQFEELSDHCHRSGITFLSTAFGIEELKLLLKLGIGAIKVPSGEITHLQLLREMALEASNNQLPVYLSTGMSTLGEVESALQIFLDAGMSRSEITLLHCLSAYPAPEDQVNLNAIKTLSLAFNCPVGYSDHTIGITAPVVAVSLGAKIIEKHITLNNNLPGPDHKASMEPKLFQNMVQAIRTTEKLLGDGIKTIQPAEKETRIVARRSLRAAKDIKAGELFTSKNIIAKRPGNGINPMNLDDFIGTKALRDFHETESLDGKKNESE